VDPHFNIPTQRFEDFLQMMIEEDLGFVWGCQCRPEAITKENSRLLAQAGCRAINMGIESGDPEVLKNMDRSATVDGIARGIDLLHERGMFIVGSIIVGFPGETEQSIDKTIALLNSHDVDFYIPYIFIYYHHTPIFHVREKFDLQGSFSNWQHRTMDSLKASEYFEYLLFNCKSNYTIESSESMVLFGEAYSTEKMNRLGRLKDDLVRLSLRETTDEGEGAVKRDAILTQIESLI
jgi:p-methyltransferase